MSILPTSLLNWIVGIIPFKACVEEFEHGLDSIFMDSVNILELNESFDEPDVIVGVPMLGTFSKNSYNCSMFPASYLMISYDARLEDYICLFHWQEEYQTLN